MVIKNETQNFITIDTTKEDAVFLFHSLNLGIQNIPLNNDTRTRMISFIRELGCRLNMTMKYN